MRARFIFSGLVGLALILGSCGTSNSVVSNGLIQKRKYNKGFFLKSNGQFKTAKADVKEEKTLDVAGIDEEKFNTVSEEMPVTQAIKPVSNSDSSAGPAKQVRSSESARSTQSADHSVGKIVPRSSNERVNNFIHKNTQRGLRKSVREKAEKAKVAAASDSMSTGEIITLILIIVLIILAFTLLNRLTYGWLGWLVGLILTVVLIVLILRWLDVI